MRLASILVGTALLLSALIPPAGSATTPRSVELTVAVAGLRSHEGVIRIAVCAPDTGFPQCRQRAVANLVIPAGQTAEAHILLPPGSYAVSAFHDRNNNGRLDKSMGIPREGFAFSRNPPLRMRPATFDEARLEVDRPLRTTVQLRHLL